MVDTRENPNPMPKKGQQPSRETDRGLDKGARGNDASKGSQRSGQSKDDQTGHKK